MRDPFGLADYTHAYPEWVKYEDSILRRGSNREEMDYRDFLENADHNRPEFKRLADPFVAVDRHEKVEIIEQMIEQTLLFT